VDWKIRTPDGATFSSDDGSWESAPKDIVAATVRHELYGHVVLQGLDYFYKSLDGGPLDIALCDDLGPQLRLRCPWLKFGVQLPREKFQAILKQASNDPDFESKRHPSRRSTDWGNR
jgi:hypothetical protein